jgi:hypothetical protein
MSLFFLSGREGINKIFGTNRSANFNQALDDPQRLAADW